MATHGGCQYFAMCNDCHQKNAVAKSNNKSYNIAYHQCRNVLGHTSAEYIAQLYPPGTRVGRDHGGGQQDPNKEPDKMKPVGWVTYHVVGIYRTDKKVSNGKCEGGLTLRRLVRQEEVETTIECKVLLKVLRILSPDGFEYTVPRFIDTKESVLTRKAFEQLIYDANALVKTDGFVVIKSKGQESVTTVSLQRYIDQVESSDDNQEMRMVSHQDNGYAVPKPMDAALFHKKLLVSIPTQNSRKSSTAESDIELGESANRKGAFYCDQLRFVNSTAHKGYRQTSFSPSTPYYSRIDADEHGHQGGRVVVEQEGKLGPHHDAVMPAPESDLESGNDEGDQDDELAVRSASNWATATPHERRLGSPAEYRRMTQLVGVTTGSALLASKGAGTVNHFEQACLYSVNVLHFGFKLWFYGDGLRRWLDVTSSDLDVMAKDKVAFPTAAECEQFRINVYLQVAGETVLIGPANAHTVLSLSTTVAEASNCNPDHNHWYPKLVKELRIYLPRCYPDSVKVFPGSKPLSDEVKTEGVLRLRLWARHTADYLRVQAERIPSGRPFAKCQVGDILELGTSRNKVFVLKAGPTDLIYLLSVPSGEWTQFPSPPVLTFRADIGRSIPLVFVSEKGPPPDTIEVCRLYAGLLEDRSSTELVSLATSPHTFGQADIRGYFGVAREHYLSGAPGMKLVIGFHRGWPIGEVRRDASDTQLQTLSLGFNLINHVALSTSLRRVTFPGRDSCNQNIPNPKP